MLSTMKWHCKLNNFLFIIPKHIMAGSMERPNKPYPSLPIFEEMCYCNNETWDNLAKQRAEKAALQSEQRSTRKAACQVLLTKVLTRITRIVSFESKGAVHGFQSRGFKIYVSIIPVQFIYISWYLLQAVFGYFSSRWYKLLMKLCNLSTC